MIFKATSVFWLGKTRRIAARPLPCLIRRQTRASQLQPIPFKEVGPVTVMMPTYHEVYVHTRSIF